MKKTIKVSILALTAALCFFACQTPDAPSRSPGTASLDGTQSGRGSASGNSATVSGENVFIAGYYFASPTTIAAYWRNGVRQNLSVPQGMLGSRAVDVAMDGSDVYIAGYYNDSGKHIASYWKNGVRQDLIDTEAIPYSQDTTAITVVDSVVHIAGDSVYESNWRAIYWKDDGQQTRQELALPPSGVYTFSHDIAVSGSNVFIAGHFVHRSGADYAVYWRNGIVQNFNSGATPGKAYGIAVAGSNVHVVGYYVNSSGLDQACYWLNGVRRDLPHPQDAEFSWAYDISISGSDVYISGNYLRIINRQEIYTACYWKNGVLYDLSSPAEATHWIAAQSIEVHGSDLHIAGIYMRSPYLMYSCYWKNGERQILPIPENTTSAVSGIAVSIITAATPGITPSRPDSRLAGIVPIARADLIGTWEVEISEDGYHYIQQLVFNEDGTWIWYLLMNGETTEGDRGTYTVDGDTVTAVGSFNYTLTSILRDGILNAREGSFIRAYRKR